MKNVIGIDLGTTNCCVAIMVDGRPKVIEDEKGYNILPSYIAMKGPNKFIVGHGAKAQAISNPQNTLRAVKRLIGRKINTPEVAEARKRMGFDIIEGPNYDILLRIGDATMTPTEASSVLLKCIKGIAEQFLGQEVSEAVITCPAYFTNAQRKATIEAGQKAGLKVLRLLNEPTAAALAYGYKRDLERRLLVYDLGGGTFDVSILEVGDNVYEVLATNGDSYLGGEDFDNRVVDHLAAEFKERHGVDLRDDPVALQRLKDAAERAKMELSFVDRTQIMIPHVFGTTNLQAELSRDTLEALTEDLVQGTFDIVARTLEEANLSVSEVDEFILVGGQTRMPRIQEMVKSFFGRPPCKGVHPDEAVAIGACVHADALTEDKGDILLLDVTPFALGIDSAGDVFTQIVPKNSTIPVAESRTFTTVVDNQEKVKIVVRQGEIKRASENKFLGEFVLTGIRRAPKMEPKIDVVFRIDSNGILNVSAKDRFTGERQSIVIKDYFERATNPEHDAAPVVVPDPEEGEEESVGVQAVGEEEPDKEEESRSGLLGRLVGGLGKGIGKRRKKKRKQKDESDVRDEENQDEGEEITEVTAVAEDEGPALDADEQPSGITEVPEAADATGPPDAPEAGSPSFDPYGVVPLENEYPVEQDLPVERDESGDDTPPLEIPEQEWEDDPFATADEQGKSPDYEDPFAIGDDAIAPGSTEDPFAMSGTEGDPFGEEALDPYELQEKPTDLTGPPVRPAAPTREEKEPSARPIPTPSPRAHPVPSPQPPPVEDPALSLDHLFEDEPEPVTDLGGPPPVSSPGTPGPETSGHRSSAPASRGEETPGEFDVVERVASPAAGAESPVRTPSPPLPGFDDAYPVEKESTESKSAFVARSGKHAPSGPPRKRKPARLKIAYRRVDAFVSEYGENLARGGTFIKTPKPLDEGRECVFELTIPGRDTPIMLKGVVVWSSKGKETLEEGQERGMAIKYLFDEGTGKREIEQLLDELRIAG